MEINTQKPIVVNFVHTDGDPLCGLANANAILAIVGNQVWRTQVADLRRVNRCITATGDNIDAIVGIRQRCAILVDTDVVVKDLYSLYIGHLYKDTVASIGSDDIAFVCAGATDYVFIAPVGDTLPTVTKCINAVRLRANIVAGNRREVASALE